MPDLEKLKEKIRQFDPSAVERMDIQRDLTIEEVRKVLTYEEMEGILERIRLSNEQEELMKKAEEVSEELTRFVRDLIRASDEERHWAVRRALDSIFQSVEEDESGNVTIRPNPPSHLGAHLSTGFGRTRRTRLDRTQEREFRILILEVLDRFGGRAHATDDVRPRLEDRMKGRFRPDDNEPVASTGEPRWWVTAKFEKKRMVGESPPLINPTADRGWWEITPAGRSYLASRGAESGSISSA